MEDQKLHLKTIERITSISKKEFYNIYVKKQRPVIVEHFVNDWKATNNWSLDYIKKIGGFISVPLYDNRIPINNSKNKFNEPHLHLPLSEYIDLLKKGPTPYRIFLFNLLKKIPNLQKDFSFPKGLNVRFLKDLPMLFFGGENSKVFMHYDIDYANIFHFHFEGTKKCILFPPSETKYLYKLPNSLVSHPDIDFNNPDFNTFPALAKAKGYVTELKHGEMLYMPEGYWHQMTYKTPGFSMSLRALPKNYWNLTKAVYNVFIMRYFDNAMRKILTTKWENYKYKTAIKRTNAKTI